MWTLLIINHWIAGARLENEKETSTMGKRVWKSEAALLDRSSKSGLRGKLSLCVSIDDVKMTGHQSASAQKKTVWASFCKRPSLWKSGQRQGTTQGCNSSSAQLRPVREHSWLTHQRRRGSQHHILASLLPPLRFSFPESKGAFREHGAGQQKKTQKDKSGVSCTHTPTPSTEPTKKFLPSWLTAYSLWVFFFSNIICEVFLPVHWPRKPHFLAARKLTQKKWK